MLSNLGTRGYHCKELPVPRGWKTWLPTWQPLVTIVRNCRFLKVGTHGYQPGNQRLPLQGTAGCQNWNSWLPTLEPVATIASNCWFPKVGTHGSQRWNHGLPMQGTADSQRLELMVRYRFVLLIEPVAKRFVLLNGPVAESLRLADGPV